MKHSTFIVYYVVSLVKKVKYFRLICIDHGPHDIRHHESFFTDLDPIFIGYLRDRVKNLYELVAAIISYLLKYPAARASFQQNMLLHLHCPFCGGQKGLHDYNKHEVCSYFFRSTNK